MKKIKKLDAETIREYTQLRLKFVALEEECKEFSDAIKKYMKKHKLELAAPSDSRYALKLTSYEQKDVDRVKIIAYLAKKIFGKHYAKEREYLKLVKKHTHPKPIDRLEKPDLNPNYKKG